MKPAQNSHGLVIAKTKAVYARNDSVISESVSQGKIIAANIADTIVRLGPSLKAINIKTQAKINTIIMRLPLLLFITNLNISYGDMGGGDHLSDSNVFSRALLLSSLLTNIISA